MITKPLRTHKTCDRQEDLYLLPFHCPFIFSCCLSPSLLPALPLLLICLSLSLPSAASNTIQGDKFMSSSREPFSSDLFLLATTLQHTYKSAHTETHTETYTQTQMYKIIVSITSILWNSSTQALLFSFRQKHKKFPTLWCNKRQVWGSNKT